MWLWPFTPMILDIRPVLNVCVSDVREISGETEKHDDHTSIRSGEKQSISGLICFLHLVSGCSWEVVQTPVHQYTPAHHHWPVGGHAAWDRWHQHHQCDYRLVLHHGLQPLCSCFTGAVKVTPAHDHTDFLLSQRHSLPRLTVIEGDGTMMPVCGPWLEVTSLSYWMDDVNIWALGHIFIIFTCVYVCVSGGEAVWCQAACSGCSGGEEAVQRKEDSSHDFTCLQVKERMFPCSNKTYETSIKSFIWTDEVNVPPALQKSRNKVSASVFSHFALQHLSGGYYTWRWLLESHDAKAWPTQSVVYIENHDNSLINLVIKGLQMWHLVSVGGV